MISFHVPTIKFDLPQKSAVKKWINLVVEAEKKHLGELSFVFFSDEELLQVNRQYLKHDYYTDVITFDYSDEIVISGDIFVSVDTVKENAVRYKQSFEKELFRVMVHGVLHLCGHDDKNARSREAMRALEDFYLKEIPTLL